jgi:hypothetical protein
VQLKVMLDQAAEIQSKRVGRRSEAAACSWRYAAVTGTPNTNFGCLPLPKACLWKLKTSCESQFYFQTGHPDLYTSVAEESCWIKFRRRDNSNAPPQGCERALGFRVPVSAG